MSSKPNGGLGGFSMREAAVSGLFSQSTEQSEAKNSLPETVTDQDSPEQSQGVVASDTASSEASSSASRKSSDTASGKSDKRAGNKKGRAGTDVVEAPPPPPKRVGQLREQFNVRAKTKHKTALERYRDANGTTTQAIFDQMVEEYCARRKISFDEE